MRWICWTQMRTIRGPTVLSTNSWTFIMNNDWKKYRSAKCNRSILSFKFLCKIFYDNCDIRKAVTCKLVPIKVEWLFKMVVWLQYNDLFPNSYNSPTPMWKKQGFFWKKIKNIEWRCPAWRSEGLGPAESKEEEN